MQTDNASEQTGEQKKRCTECGAEKPLSEYHAGGSRQPCKSCRAAWYRTHNLEQIARNHNAKAKRVGVSGTLTADDLAGVLEEQGAACLICGASENLHFDHIISFFARGDNVRENLQVLCRSHNSSKGRMCIDYRP